jgi:hypothetical protein
MAEILTAVRVVGRTERLEYLLETEGDGPRNRRSTPFSKESLDKIAPLFTDKTLFQIVNKKTGRRYGVARHQWLTLSAKDLMAVGKRGSS